MQLIRQVSGVIFLLSGGLKLCAIPGFAAVLDQCGVPLPQLAAVAVPLLEVGGGAALVANKQPRLAAAALAVNLVFAIALVGLPGARGARFHGAGHTVGGEPWRAPLEVGLLLSLVMVMRRGSTDAEIPGT